MVILRKKENEHRMALNEFLRLKDVLRLLRYLALPLCHLCTIYYYPLFGKQCWVNVGYPLPIVSIWNSLCNTYLMTFHTKNYVEDKTLILYLHTLHSTYDVAHSLIYFAGTSLKLDKSHIWWAIFAQHDLSQYSSKAHCYVIYVWNLQNCIYPKSAWKSLKSLDWKR